MNNCRLHKVVHYMMVLLAVGLAIVYRVSLTCNRPLIPHIIHVVRNPWFYGFLMPSIFLTAVLVFCKR